MKKAYRPLIVCLLAAGFVHVAPAQYQRTAYFMDQAVARTAINPAFTPDRGYLSVPFIGAIDLSMTSNSLALDNFIYERPGGRLVTFLDASVPADRFLSGLKTNNQINFDLSAGLVNLGWHGRNAFWTVDLNLRSSSHANVPKSLFAFIKQGTGPEGATHNISGLGMRLDTWAELAVGYARPIGDRLSVGGRLKLLPALGHADLQFDRLDAELTGEQWAITSRGSLYASFNGLGTISAQNDRGDEYIDELEFDDFGGLAGFGAAVDLGASYRLSDQLTLSASVLDLGFISWKKSNAMYAVSDGSFLFEGFDLPVGSHGDESVGDQLDALTDDLEDLFRLRRQNEQQSRTTGLAFTFNAGAEYAVLDRKLSFGLLSSTRFYKQHPYTELTLSVNARPNRWFTGTLSYSAVHNAFDTFGLALNVHPSWINFFIGADYMVGRVTPQFIPVSARAMNFHFGLAVPLGRRRADRAGR